MIELCIEQTQDYKRVVYTGHVDQKWGPSTYSQNGEDLVLLNLFQLLGVAHPNYLDIGAHHPTRISNTALLYSLGCRGVNVEINNHLMNDFQVMRPADVNVNCAVAHEAGTVDYIMFDNFSGRNTCSQAVAEAYIRKYGAQVAQVVNGVRAMTINQIVDTYCNGVFPAFLNIDVEGLDYDILLSADFSKNRPVIICAESQTDVQVDRMSEMLEGKGYLTFMRMGDNIITIHADAFEAMG